MNDDLRDQVRSFLDDCEPIIRDMAMTADFVAGAKSVAEEQIETELMIDHHRKLAALLPAPDSTASDLMSRGIQLSIEGMNIVLSGRRGGAGRLRRAERRQFEVLWDRGRAEIREGLARLYALVGE